METDPTEGFVANPTDAPDGFSLTGTLPTDEPQGVHSLTDVAVYANGPGAEAFRGVFGYVLPSQRDCGSLTENAICSNVDIFFKMADALGLATFENKTAQ